METSSCPICQTDLPHMEAGQAAPNDWRVCSECGSLLRWNLDLSLRLASMRDQMALRSRSPVKWQLLQGQKSVVATRKRERREKEMRESLRGTQWDDYN